MTEFLCILQIGHGVSQESAEYELNQRVTLVMFIQALHIQHIILEFNNLSCSSF